MLYDFDHVFPRYTLYDPQVPVWCVTPGPGLYTHRFFDTPPISPSGRYLALTRMPYEDHRPIPGDRAQIVVIDLLDGREYVAAETRGWEHQLGANINWGEDDGQLIYNDMDPASYAAYAVCLDWRSGRARRLDHGVYHVSPDGRWGVAGNLAAMQKTQFGYGVPVPEERVPQNTIDTQDDGVYLVDIRTGSSRLVLSLQEIYARTHSARECAFYRQGLCYVFHTKWSPDGSRIMFSTRWVPLRLAEAFNTNGGDLRFCIYTCRPDGSDLSVAIDETQWVKGGHHTNWLPDGSGLTMNLDIELDGLRFCRASLAGRHVEKLFGGEIPGSGHPSLHRSGKILITDTYAYEPMAYGDGTVPIRVIDMEGRRELPPALRIRVAHPYNGVGAFLRVDPHPVWDRTGRYCILNGHPDDANRRVYIADMARYL